MSSSSALREEKENLPDPALGAFIEAFARVFKIGIYYPLGHAVLDQATAKFVQQLREISPSLRTIRVVITSGQIMVENQTVEVSSGSAKDLHQFLVKLGIQTITFARTLQHKHFLQFTRSLLAWRVKLESSRSLIDFDLGEMPEGIEVEQQRYQAGGERSAEGGDTQGQKELEELFSALGEQGLSPEQLAQCRELIEGQAEAFGDRHIDSKEYPHATWKDMQALLYRIVTGSYSPFDKRFEATANADINVLSAILQSLERESADKRARESIHLLVSHLTGGTAEKASPPALDKGLAGRQEQKPPVASPGKRRQTDTPRPACSIAELKNYLAENDIPQKILQKLVAVDRSEELSILLQVAGKPVGQTGLDAVQNRLAAIVVTDLTRREEAVLIAGLVELSNIAEENSAFPKLIGLVLATLRSDDECPRSLNLLAKIWRNSANQHYPALWPLLVNELLLLGPEKGGDGFYECLEISSRLPIERMRQLRQGLEDTPVFREKSPAPEVFRPAYIYCYRLFAFLIETSLAENIAQQVVDGLAKDPQEWLAVAVMPWLDLQQPGHQDFLCRYLVEVSGKEPPLALKMAAGDLLAGYLTALDEGGRQAPWLPETIAAAARLPARSLPEVLTRVVEEKKLMVVPTWPKACRRAAGEALKVLKRKTLKNLR
jgi:hypothetical protein